MSISHIQNIWLRRGVIIIAFLPVMLAGVVIGAFYGAGEYCADILSAVIRAWSAKK